MRLLLIILGILMLPTATKSAEVFTIYECEFKVGNDQFLAPDLTVFVSEDSEKAFAIDGMIHYVFGDPIPVEIVENSDKKIVAKWAYDVKDMNARSAKLQFRFSYAKSNGRANITSRPVKYTNSDVAHGTCTISRRKF